MYEFLADPSKTAQEVAEAFDKIEDTHKTFPEISWEELKNIPRTSYTVVYSNMEDWSIAKPVYIITTRKFPLVCWIRIKQEEGLPKLL